MGFLDVLGVQLETAHTRLLAWLLDPNGDHGLGPAVLRGFCKEVLGHVPNLASATVEIERPELASRGDITIQTSKHYIVVENKINEAAFKASQLIAHARGASHRCRGNDRQAWVVLIVPDKRRQGSRGFPKHPIGCRTSHQDWRRIVDILRVVAASAPRESTGRAFIPVYVDFIEREILEMWKGFNEDFLDDEAVKAAALYASKMTSVEDAFWEFSNAVNLRLNMSRGARMGTSRGLQPMGDQHMLCSRQWKLDAHGRDMLMLGVYVYPGAVARKSVELWAEMWVQTPKLVTAGIKAGWTRREAVRRLFGKGAGPYQNPDDLYITTKVPQSVWLVHSPNKADHAIAAVSQVVTAFWNQYEKLAKKR